MKNFKLKNILLSLMILTTFSIADHEPNNICSSQAEIIGELDGISTSKDRQESGWVHKSRDEYDIYKFTVAQDGKLKITTRGKSTKFSFFVGTSCANYKDIFSDTQNRTKKDVPEFNVNKGQTIYLKVQRRYNRWMKYKIDISYQAEEVNQPTPEDNEFKLKYITSLKGNIKVIGNTVLYGSQSSNESNANTILSYIDVDGKSNTFNSSKASIQKVQSGVNIDKAKIVWAGLYWQGYMHSNDKDTGIDKKFHFNMGKLDKHLMLSTINNQVLKLSLKTGEKFNVVADDVYIDQQYDENNYIAYKYAAFKEVTDLLKDKSPINEYTVANIATREGKTSSGDKYDGLGNYGAWTLVIIYNNEDEVGEKMRNLSVFNGYEVLSAAYNPKSTIKLEGFRTPEYTPNGVDSSISIFAGEGDRNILGDSAKLINEDGLVYQLPNASGTDSYFASAIEGVPERNPKLENNNGIDIHTNKVGTFYGFDKPIRENQTKAYLEMKSTQDTYMPSMVAFATELFTPKLCYDYSLGLGDEIKIPSEGRRIDTSSYGKDLSMKVLIRSQEGDFTFSKATVAVEFTPDKMVENDDQMTYVPNSSLVSPPFVNAYIPVPDVTAAGEVAIGKLSSDKLSGSIDSLESSYLKQKYTFDKGSFKGVFNIRVKGEIKFDGVSVPVKYDLTTKDGTGRLEECETNQAYNPVWGEYNIEREAFMFNPMGIADEVKYPLYTQVAGKDFSVYLKRYKYNPMTKKYDLPFPVFGNIEVELIDAGLFDNNEGSGYDSSCEEPDRIGGSSFLTIGKAGMPSAYRKINIPEDISEFDNTRALKNIAFRMWFLGAYDSKDKFYIIDHHCFPSVNNSCFKTLYNDNFKKADRLKLCESDCVTNFSSEKCYHCLKINFAKPICSRDNFAIKPAAFRIEIADNQEGAEEEMSLIKNDKEGSVKLAAGYNYNLNIESKLNESETIATGYYKNDYKKEKLESLDDVEEYIGLKSKNKEECFDKNNYTYNYTFIDGKIYEDSLMKHKNVGVYDFTIEDNSWTEVDQANYIHKNTFNGVKTNDCIIDDDRSSGPYTEKVGCNISSFVDDTHKKIETIFYPYSFSMEEVEFDSVPVGKDKLFMNNFELPTYSEGNIFMGANVKGYLSAVDKDGDVTTNFTEDCEAEDVTLKIDRETSPVAEEDLVAIKGLDTEVKVEFQQYLDQDYGDDKIVVGKDKTVVLDKEEFRSIKPGKAEVNLYLTFKKPTDSVISPIRALFKDFNASSEDCKSNANKSDEYIPEGIENYNKEIDYYFGKVTPFRKLYGPTKDAKADTPIYVDIYCLDRTGMTCADFGLTNHTKGKDEDFFSWYNAKDVFNNSDLGVVKLNVSTILGTDASPIALDSETDRTENIPFDDAAAGQEDIDVKLLGQDRPSVVQVQVVPSPWLIYDKYNVTGYPTYKVKFIGNSFWTGVGETGKIIDSEANAVPSRRMHW